MTNKTMDELLDAPEPSKPMSRQIEELVNKFERSVGAFGVEEKFVVERRKELRTSLTKAYNAGQVEALEWVLEELNGVNNESIEFAVESRLKALKAKTDNPTEQ